MKKVYLLILVAIVSLSSSVIAQELKFGHLDVQKLIVELPEKAKADKIIQAEQAKLQEQLQVMTSDLERKYTEYMTQRDSLPELIRATKEKEIQDQDQRIKNYQSLAQQSLQTKNQEVLEPIIEKVQNAIDAVGAELGLIYIFDISSQVIVYHSEKSIDVADSVKAKLGIQ